MMAGMENDPGYDEDEDFYEDDEPVEKILAQFRSGSKFVTSKPTTFELSGPAQAIPSSSNWPARISVRPARRLPIRVAVA